VLELSGLGAADWGVNVGTRKVGMAGSGRISNASHNRFRLGGVSALAGGAEAVKYLYLGGTRDGGDEILDLTDGAGTLGVVKDGSGTWTLGGDVNFTGLLDVREGTLIVKRYNSRNTWFRLTATEMLQNSDYYYHYFTEAGGSASTYSLGRGYQFGPAEFGLFDAAGNQVNQGVTNCWKSSEVEANGIAYDYAGFGGIDTIQYNGNKTNNYNITRLCDGDLGSTTHSWWAGNAGGGNLSQTNSSGWVSYILRLPPGAAEVASWDVGNYYTLDANGCNRIMTACILESSPDGVNWSVVTNVTRLPLPETNLALKKYWCSDFSTSLRPHTGWPLQGDSGRTWTVMPNTPVKVASGATLRADISANETAGKPVLSSITVDLAGGGTIDGFALAASGTLNVKGLPKRLGESKFIPLNFANADGLGNVAGWTLQADGEEVRRKELKVTSDGITIIPPGMTIIVL
jgi:autotransporter-associated beta strand protein